MSDDISTMYTKDKDKKQDVEVILDGNAKKKLL